MGSEREEEEGREGREGEERSRVGDYIRIFTPQEMWNGFIIYAHLYGETALNLCRLGSKWPTFGFTELT